MSTLLLSTRQASSTSAQSDTKPVVLVRSSRRMVISFLKDLSVAWTNKSTFSDCSNSWSLTNSSLYLFSNSLSNSETESHLPPFSIHSRKLFFDILVRLSSIYSSSNAWRNPTQSSRNFSHNSVTLARTSSVQTRLIWNTICTPVAPLLAISYS